MELNDLTNVNDINWRTATNSEFAALLRFGFSVRELPSPDIHFSSLTIHRKLACEVSNSMS